ncbi:hypothetical protein JXC34_01135 [Candidatus Woesearchaeota archaeon]|nr:hypothetical protein [Candidatus Woesearchaeota archaeon]
MSDLKRYSFHLIGTEPDAILGPESVQELSDILEGLSDIPLVLDFSSAISIAPKFINNIIAHYHQRFEENEGQIPIVYDGEDVEEIRGLIKEKNYESRLPIYSSTLDAEEYLLL